MEIGWPPFVDPIINGHANEAQVSRDLLSMSIAVYNEDTVPYRYTSFALLEQLVPMREFEYQSPRHNQGVDYGAYRFGWEMHGAMLFYRMLGQKLYPDNLKNLPYYWLYMRLPNGYMLRDGDMFSNKNAKNREIYWKQPQTMLLCYAYLNDPVLKGEFEREGGLPDDPVLYLLLNDPSIKPVMQPSHLPLSKDFGKVLGGMLARTGWNNTPASDDVVAEVKGGGYLFGNHQHSDAGAIQLYYHGMQLGDIGLYLSYGSPYDYNFNKRSVAHSMMLAYDPKEKLYYRAKTNDGGTRFSQRFPVSPEQTLNDPWFNGGAVLSAAAGPDPVRPLFSYFKAELSPAYSAKLSSYTRSFCFLHLNNPNVPAVIILADAMETASPNIKQYWQVNAFNRPDMAGSKIMLHSSEAGVTGYTAVDMLLPKPADREMSILGGDSSRNVFGTYYAVDTSWPESRAYRIMISPRERNRKQHYLTVFQMTKDSSQLLPIHFTDHGQWYELRIDQIIQITGAGKDAVTDSMEFNVPEREGGFTLVATGLNEGFWHLQKLGEDKSHNFYVRPGENTLQTTLTEGHYKLLPGRSYEGYYMDEPNGLPYILK
jgi:heparin/heparan-sulfate lyase